VIFKIIPNIICFTCGKYDFFRGINEERQEAQHIEGHSTNSSRPQLDGHMLVFMFNNSELCLRQVKQVVIKPEVIS
jgi:hypothetical protein